VYIGQTYKHQNTSVTLINYHFVWVPRRRRPVLTGKIASRLKRLLEEKAKELSIDIVALEIQSDHVHLFVNCLPNIAPNQIMFRLKGYSARILRKEFPQLLRLPSMWTTSYFASTAGTVSNETIRRYIEAQSKQ
jgi:putative transposase